MFIFTTILQVLLILRLVESKNGIVSNNTEPKTSRQLVELLYEEGFIDKTIAKVMLNVDRKFYAPLTPYRGCQESIGYGATIDSSRMHAFALETLRYHLKKGSKALDVGCGSGYLTICMAKMVGTTGRVVGMDHMPQLVENAKSNVMKDNPLLLKKQRVKFVVGDGRLGYPDDGPYDAIFVGASTEVVPQELRDQLKFGGRMMIPVYFEYNYTDMFIVNRRIKDGDINQWRVPIHDFQNFAENFTDKENQWPSSGNADIP